MRHSEFILTGLSKILEEASVAIHNVGKGVDTLPLRDYFLQSLFLRMTGAQEQKCKCVCWDLGTYDYEFRYRTFTDWKLGECSSLKDKSSVFSAVMHALERLKVGNVAVVEERVRKSILVAAQKAAHDFYDSCSALGWPEKEINEFDEVFKEIKPSCIALQSTKEDRSWKLLASKCEKCERRKTQNFPSGCDQSKGGFLTFSLSDLYDECVYRHRNECAHNTLSYQMNRPSFSLMSSQNFLYHNYYLRFAILIVLDELLMSAYRQWKDAINSGGCV